MYLFAAHSLLSALCPFTLKGIGQLIGFLSTIASFVFFILTFIVTPHWWYGLITAGIYMLCLLITPKINPEEVGPRGILLSNIGSLADDIIIVFMFITLLR